MDTITRIVQPGDVVDEKDLIDPHVRVRTAYEPRPDVTTVNGVVVDPNPTPSPVAVNPVTPSSTDGEPLED